MTKSESRGFFLSSSVSKTTRPDHSFRFICRLFWESSREDNIQGLDDSVPDHDHDIVLISVREMMSLVDSISMYKVYP